METKRTESDLSTEERERVKASLDAVRNAGFSVIDRVDTDAPRSKISSFMRKPFEAVEKRKALKTFESSVRDIDKALDDPVLRGEALNLLLSLRERAAGKEFTDVGKAFTGEICNFVQSHIEDISPRFGFDTGEDVERSTELIVQLLEEGKERMHKKGMSDWHDQALASIEGSVSALPEFIGKVKDSHGTGREALDHIDRYVNAVLSSGREDSSRVAREIVRILLLDRKVSNPHEACLDTALNTLLESSFTSDDLLSEWDENAEGPGIVGSVRNENREFCKHLFQDIGLNPEEFLSAVNGSCKEGEKNVFLRKNARAALEVAAERPEAVKILSGTFGIQTYGRYPTQLLIDQYDNLNNTEGPYGIIMYPRADHNGAFFNETEKTVLTDFAHDNKAASYQVRVFEAGSRIDVAKKLLTANKLYGDKHKISYAIIGGHGSIDSIDLGDSRKIGNIASLTIGEILEGKGTVRAVHGFFVEKPTFVFNSCSTGGDFGIAEVFADKMTQADVIAPTRPIERIKRLHFSNPSKEGYLKFDVEFDEGINSDKWLRKIKGETLEPVTKHIEGFRSPETTAKRMEQRRLREEELAKKYGDILD